MLHYRKIILLLIIFFFTILAKTNYVFSQGVTDVYFTPFNIIEQIFYILFLFSSLVIIFILLFNTFYYFRYRDNADKLKIVKNRVVSATQGGALILLSFIILTLVSGQMTRLGDIILTSVPGAKDSFSYNWEHRDAYFQIPFGLLIESSMIGEDDAISNFSRVLSRTKRSNEEIQRLYSISTELMVFFEDGCNSSDRTIFAQINRDDKVNVFTDPVNMITAKAYLDKEVYNFQSIDDIDINNWRDGDIVIGSPTAIGSLSSTQFNNINGIAIRIYGEDRIATEMALRSLTRYSENDKNYGSLFLTYSNEEHLENLKIYANFRFNNTAPNKCPSFISPTRRAEASVIIDSNQRNINIIRRGILVLKEEDPIICPRETIWTRGVDNLWVIRCGDDYSKYLDSMNSFYRGDIIISSCPSLSLCDEGVCHCHQDDFCLLEGESCRLDSDCLELNESPLPLSIVSRYLLLLPFSKNNCDAIYSLQEELLHYTNRIENHFEQLSLSKDPISDSLYQLFKSTTLLSLFSEAEELIDYSHFNNIRNSQPRQRDMFVFTFNEEYYEKYFQENNNITVNNTNSWGKWTNKGVPKIEYIETQNDPSTFYIKMDSTNNGYWDGAINNRIKSALRLSLAVKEEGGLQFAEDMDFLDELFPPPPRDEFQNMHPPVDPEKTRVSSFFRMRRFPVPGFHRGVDFARRDSRQVIYPIYAVEQGRVIHSGPAGNYGQLIIIHHYANEIDGLSNDIRTYYAHLATGSLRVKTGDRVERGERIAVMGTTGFSTGIHLHFEVREENFSWGSQVNPFNESENFNNNHYIDPLWWNISSLLKATQSKPLLANFFSFSKDVSAQELPSSLLLRCVEEKSLKQPLKGQEACYRVIEECLQRESIPLETTNNFSSNEINSIISICGLTLTDIMTTEEKSTVTCGKEIPIGEAFEITWTHLVQLLNNTDLYTGKGQEYLLKQKALTRMISQCSYQQNKNSYMIDVCPDNYQIEYTDTVCRVNEDCLSGVCDILSDNEDSTGYCIKEEDCCPLKDIKELQQEIASIKEDLLNIKNNIIDLTYGVRNVRSENICVAHHSDVTTSQENIVCSRGGEIKITKGELIKRKLYLSRYSLDRCFDYENYRTTSIIAPIADKHNFFREVKKDPVMTTICCCPLSSEQEISSLCPQSSPYIINRGCREIEIESGCSNNLVEKTTSSSNFNWFCCNK